MRAIRCSCLLAAVLASPALAGEGSVLINEVRVGQLADDTDEYFELIGEPGASLDGLYYVEVTDVAGNDGVVRTVVNLFGQSIRPSGLHTTVENSFTLPGVPNQFLPSGELFDGGNTTHVLVSNFTGMPGDDLDDNDDGILDTLPWSAILDCVALVGPGVPGTDGAHVYCAAQVGPDGEFTPGHAYRCTTAGTWTVGEFDIDDPGATDTPGTPNTSCDFIPPCGSGLAGSCFVANGTPYCDDAACCQLIIDNFDPTCATVWDQLCADLAQLNCSSCGDPAAGSCFEANGTAYCDIGDCCTTVCGVDPTCCQLNGWDQACADLALVNCPLTAIQQGDVVIGLSLADPDLSIAIARGDAVENGGTLVDDSWSQPFIQSVELDNLDGISHNPQGNLLGVNFGTTADGGTIHSLATCEAVGPGELIGNTTGLGGSGITLTRLSGISVSPGNDKIAVIGYDSGKVIVYDYTPGNCFGVGASLSGARETSQNPMCLADTQGTAWLDNNTVLAFSSVGNVWSINATTMVPVSVAVLGSTCGPTVTDIEYNPNVSSLVFCTSGEFVASTTNTLWILDPDSGWSTVSQLDYSTSSDTFREIALDRSGNLFLTQFSGNVEVILNAAGAALLGGPTDNDSLDWFATSTEVAFASFSGIDVAVGIGSATCPWDCEEPPSGDVGIGDFLSVLGQWGMEGSSCDLGIGAPGVGVDEFLKILGLWGPCP